MLSNCVNCGAPLHGNKCEYCGAEYGEHLDSVHATFQENDLYGKVQIGNKSYDCYIAKVEIDCLDDIPYRAMGGTLRRNRVSRKHKFTFIEK